MAVLHEKQVVQAAKAQLLRPTPDRRRKRPIAREDSIATLHQKKIVEARVKQPFAPKSQLAVERQSVQAL